MKSLTFGCALLGNATLGSIYKKKGKRKEIKKYLNLLYFKSKKLIRNSFKYQKKRKTCLS